MRSGREGLLPHLPLESRGATAISRARDRVIVLANRAPYRHEYAPDGRVMLTRAASGLVTALEPLVAACAGTWVAHVSGSADDCPAAQRTLSAEAPYRLRYVRLDPDQHRGYYYGFANEALWPLCHAVSVAPVFRASDFRDYDAANARFAAVVAHEAAGGSPLVLVQDYHFGLAPRYLRKLLPSSTIAGFWHIPWPHPRLFRTCPWHRELLTGVLGNDLVGFQTEEHAANFVECVRSLLRADVDAHRSISYCRHTTHVGVYPVGVDADAARVWATPAAAVCRARVLHDFDLPQTSYIGLGIDRLDYTKGIQEKFLTIERLLETCPSLRGRFAFIQIAEPSRDCLPAYREERARIRETTARVNGRYGTTSYTPIRLLEAHHDADEVYRLYRAADVCYVGSLDDGMNLVAKEFVAARNDERGVLVLSEFTGAARQLRTALLINPFAIDETAATLAKAVTMPEAEQRGRMRLLRANVRTCDAGWWAGRFLADAYATRGETAADAESPGATDWCDDAAASPSALAV
jgi:trehalose 6-phosphate synthase